MIRVTITEQMEKTARQIEKDTLANLKTATNYTRLEAKDRYYKGALGELAFEKVLIKYKKQYIYNPKQDGNSDKGDFCVTTNNNTNEWIDVKTGGGTHLKEMFVPLKQYARKKYPAYIGCRINDDVVEVWGFCLPSDLIEIRSRIPALGYPYEDMFSIDRFMEQIK